MYAAIHFVCMDRWKNHVTATILNNHAYKVWEANTHDTLVIMLQFNSTKLAQASELDLTDLKSYN
jgi:hypothetical protein